MKKISLLFIMMLLCGISVMAQNSVPRPYNPEASDWIDSNPVAWPDGTFSLNSQFEITWGHDIMGNLVADDYPGFEAEVESWETGEPLDYTILDEENFSYSIYTDFDRIYTFTPDKYEEFTEPTTVVPFTLGSTNNGTSHFEYWFVHFEETNKGEDLGIKRFFQWRIGVQTHYTVDGETNSSDIVYLEVFPKPDITGDLDRNGEVDVTDVNIAINIVLNRAEYDMIGDLDENGIIDVSDINAIINILLHKN